MNSPRAVQSYHTVVVCGGGCYGGYYLRQLARARQAGALVVDRIIVVDRDALCQVAQLISAVLNGDDHGLHAHAWAMRGPDRGNSPTTPHSEYAGLPVEFRCQEWEPFFNEWFAETIRRDDDEHRDAVVPSPLMPHLLADWVASRMRAHRPTATVRRVPLSSLPDTPWQRAGNDAAHYASFATWMCPVNCIEPATCPETRGPRDWTMPKAVHDAAERAGALGAPYDHVALFHTTHRVFGVGMFDARDAARTEQALMSLRNAETVRVLVASVSHCHGALAELLATDG
jgi:hypothetical protein